MTSKENIPSLLIELADAIDYDLPSPHLPDRARAAAAELTKREDCWGVIQSVAGLSDGSTCVGEAVSHEQH